MRRIALSALAALMTMAVLAVEEEVPRTRVDVTSQPNGASVIVDGIDRGVAPLTLLDLTPGRHLIRARLAGYVERVRYVNVEAGIPLQRNAVLEPEKGLLLLSSDPEGCSIEIDGATVGTTPRLVTTLDTVDAHRVVLKKAGYGSASFDVKFSGRTPLAHHTELVLDSGTLDITTDPEGASVTVNGIDRGTSPVKVEGVPKGRAAVKLRMTGYAEEIRELKINAGEVQTLAVAMKGLPGTLNLTSIPEGARIYVNGEKKGMTPLAIGPLEPGEYSVRIEKEGYGTETRTVRIDNGSNPTEEFRLSNEMGRIELRTEPAGVDVRFDGKLLGRTKSSDPSSDKSDIFAIPDVLAGEHNLVLKRDGYAEEVRHPKVKAKKTIQATVRMKRVFIPDVEITTESGKYRGVLVSSSALSITIETKPGVSREFPKSDVLKVDFLKADVQ